ncbi:hypothetical protein BJX63DRAFT_414948 [Aspergillus granulosus]|uniref:Uncharacterized protein n=1 Tax=Aspergillus granulosus TaxID=176169 RepID=A0ABR4GTT9_9EURO
MQSYNQTRPRRWRGSLFGMVSVVRQPKEICPGSQQLSIAIDQIFFVLELGKPRIRNSRLLVSLLAPRPLILNNLVIRAPPIFRLRISWLALCISSPELLPSKPLLRGGNAFMLRRFGCEACEMLNNYPFRCIMLHDSCDLDRGILMFPAL